MAESPRVRDGNHENEAAASWHKNGPETLDRQSPVARPGSG